MFKNFLKRMLKKLINKRLADDELQKVIVRKLNAKIDLPGMSEAAEAKSMNQLYDALQAVLIDVVDSL